MKKASLKVSGPKPSMKSVSVHAPWGYDQKKTMSNSGSKSAMDRLSKNRSKRWNGNYGAKVTPWGVGHGE